MKQSLSEQLCRDLRLHSFITDLFEVLVCMFAAADVG